MIKIFLFVFNRPDILELQVNTLRKFIKNNVEIIAIQDKHCDTYDEEFSNICSRLNITLHQHQANITNSPSQYHADSVQFVYDNLIGDNDLVLFLDHDMFAIDDIDLLEYIKGFDVAGLYQHRGNITYLWPGITLFKYNSIKDVDFNFSPTHNLDTGGGTYKLFESNLKIKDTGVEYPEYYNNLSLDKFNYPFELHMDKKFLHMRNACQWNNNFQVTDLDKTEVLKQILNDLCK